MKQMCKKKFQSPCVCRNELSKPRWPNCVCKLGRGSFTDYSKATRVRKFYTAYTGVVETNFLKDMRGKQGKLNDKNDYTIRSEERLLTCKYVNEILSISEIHKPPGLN